MIIGAGAVILTKALDLGVSLDEVGDPTVEVGEEAQQVILSTEKGEGAAEFLVAKISHDEVPEDHHQDSNEAIEMTTMITMRIIITGSLIEVERKIGQQWKVIWVAESAVEQGDIGRKVERV